MHYPLLKQFYGQSEEPENIKYIKIIILTRFAKSNRIRKHNIVDIF